MLLQMYQEFVFHKHPDGEPEEGGSLKISRRTGTYAFSGKYPEYRSGHFCLKYPAVLGSLFLSGNIPKKGTLACSGQEWALLLEVSCMQGCSTGLGRLFFS
jgi:hypothetical protein